MIDGFYQSMFNVNSSKWLTDKMPTSYQLTRDATQQLNAKQLETTQDVVWPR